MGDFIPDGLYTIDCPDVPNHYLTVIAQDPEQTIYNVQLVEKDQTIKMLDVWEVLGTGGGAGEFILRHVPTGNVLDLRGAPPFQVPFDQFTDCIVFPDHQGINQRWLPTQMIPPDMTFRICSLAGCNNYVTVLKRLEDRANPISMNVEPGPLEGNRWYRWRFNKIGKDRVVEDGKLLPKK